MGTGGTLKLKCQERPSIASLNPTDLRSNWLENQRNSHKELRLIRSRKLSRLRANKMKCM